MGGQVRLVHVTVLGDWLAACLAARFASVAVPARGVGVALGSGGPTLFVFLGWGACARDRAEGGVRECGRAFVCVRAGRGSRVIGRGMVYAYLAGRGPTKTRCGWLCVSCWSHPVFGDSLCGF